MINKMFENFDALLYLKNSLYPGFNDDENTDYLKIISGLKASAGAVIISQSKSVVFVDGRYELAAKISLVRKKFSIETLSFKNIIAWIKANVELKSKIAFDPKFFSLSFMKKIKTELSSYDFLEVDLDSIFKAKKFRRKSEIISWKCEESKFDSIYKIISENNLDG